MKQYGQASKIKSLPFEIRTLYIKKLVSKLIAGLLLKLFLAIEIGHTATRKVKFFFNKLLTKW